MKRQLLKKIIASILFVCTSVAMLIFCGVFRLETADATAADMMDLSFVRRIYISDDNIGYTSTIPTELPFDGALTSISAGSTTGGSFEIDQFNSRAIPVIRINSAADFLFAIDFADKKNGDSIYHWSTEERVVDTIISSEYFVSSDSWGATQTSEVQQGVLANGLNLVIGQIGTGALTVQTSQDGFSWVNIAQDKYDKGLYTTNALESFHGTRQYYTLSGQAIKQGSYVSISFFYEVRHVYTHYYTTQKQDNFLGIPIGQPYTVEHFDEKEEFLNICETYALYVVEDNPEVITFNNLTLADKVEEIKSVQQDGQNLEEYQAQSVQQENYLNALIDQITQTMYDGDMSTTGFRINMTANPYLKVSIKKDGEPFSIEKTKKNDQIYYEILENGRYDITINSYSKQKTISLYVHAVDAEEAYQYYFGERVLFNGQSYGDEFLDYAPGNSYGNVRVFDANSQIPVFEGKLTLNLKEYALGNAFPLYGFIVNQSTGGISQIDSKCIELNEYGEYELIFATNADYYEGVIRGNLNVQLAGDVRVYKFRFQLLGQDRDATINEQLLSTGNFKEMSIATPSDYVPTFYGVKRSSANKGEVIVAFADRESALKYAKEVVWSEIETHVDANGNTYWLIPNMENLAGAKIESYSGWKNAQVIRELAEKMVEGRKFDMTKASSYLTLDKNVDEIETENVDVLDVLTNLQLVSLEKSIVIWYNSEHRIAARAIDEKIEDVKILKFLGKQNYAVISKDETGVYSQVTNGECDYRFIKDVLGLDSYIITAEDSQGNCFQLNYEEGFYRQLSARRCPSGLLLITETNVYDSVTAQYYVYYIAEGYQPATIALKGDGQELYISQENMPPQQSFEKVTIMDIVDYVDLYSYVRIINQNSDKPTVYYSIADVVGMEIIEKGQYEIAVIDRFGNSISYSFAIV